VRDGEVGMQRGEGRLRRAAQNDRTRNNNGNAGGVRDEEYFGRTGFEAGGGGVSRASRGGLKGIRISGSPKLETIGRKRSLGSHHGKSEIAAGKLNEPSFEHMKEGPSSSPKDVLGLGSGQAQRHPFAPVARLRMADDTTEVYAQR